MASFRERIKDLARARHAADEQERLKIDTKIELLVQLIGDLKVLKSKE